MRGGRDFGEEALHLCTVCWQVFPTFEMWRNHANGPWPDIDSAMPAHETLTPGDAIPGGLRVGNRKCWYPEEEPDPGAELDIEQGDLVYDDEAGRAVGIVGHSDTASVDVEPFDGGTKGIARSRFLPDGRFRAIRLE